MSRKFKIAFYICLSLCLISLAYVWKQEATLFTTNFTRLLEGRESSLIKARADVYDQTTKEKNISKQDAVANRVLKKIPPNKVILLWDTRKTFFNKQSVADPHHCGFCQINRNRDIIADADTAAVMFDARSPTYLSPPRDPRRRSDQLYVFWTLESPGNTQYYNKEKIDLRSFGEYYFNGTLTFRRDSTFYTQTKNSNSLTRPIDLIRSGWQGVERNTTKLLANKDKVAVWFVSNCRGGSNGNNRMRLSEELIKNGLKLDRFGRCFKNKPADDTRWQMNQLTKRYKFYLSFENSLHCRDYITEKFTINALVSGLVPVVYGPVRENYEAMAPPHSFIHVEDFNNSMELVNYLKYLDGNDSAYAEYFSWRDMDAKSLYPYGKYMGFCALCRALYGIPLEDKRPFEQIYGEKGLNYNPSIGLNFSYSIRSIHDWWIGSETKECLNAPVH